MKKIQNSFMGNLIYLVLIIALLTTGSKLIANHYAQARESFNFSPIYITVVIIVCYGGIGALLGLNGLIKAKGSSRIDISRLLLLTLPSFIVSMSYIWAYSGLFHFNEPIFSYILVNDHIPMISSVIFGFSITSSINIKK
ncbi:hypothetical protein J23TS9_36680 [Paenibacillus sp. J23TS9]|uniref:hypothetical protein n=1 Tax=Paenibacillus TaxID=44249 RepID=UPI0010A8F092|nr:MULTISPECIES: hypothetical protein [Paenibacillus]GIP28538.1 hypothetical protein J23TS9_36680 [Paenibacillus sp. J23TS9]